MEGFEFRMFGIVPHPRALGPDSQFTPFIGWPIMPGMIIRHLLAIVTGLLLTLPAMAQDDGGGTGGLIIPEAARQPAVAPWLALVVLIVLAAIVGIASFKGAKRSHQD